MSPPLKASHSIGPIFEGMFLFRTERECKDRFLMCPVDGVVRLYCVSLKSNSNESASRIFLPWRERNIHLFRQRRESNSDLWIHRRTVSHCTSRPRLAPCLYPKYINSELHASRIHLSRLIKRSVRFPRSPKIRDSPFGSGI